jgi:hypothetical protein
MDNRLLFLLSVLLKLGSPIADNGAFFFRGKNVAGQVGSGYQS